MSTELFFWSVFSLNLALGVGLCYFGFRLFKLLSSFFFGLVGFSLGLAILPHYGGVILGSLLGGLFAFWGYRFYLLTLFLLAFGTGISVGVVLVGQGNSPEELYLPLAIGLIFGLIVVWWQRTWIILTTAWDGAWSLLFTLRLYQLGPEEWERHFGTHTESWLKTTWYLLWQGHWSSLGWLLVFFFSGVLIQRLATSKEVSPKNTKEEDSS